MDDFSKSINVVKTDLPSGLQSFIRVLSESVVWGILLAVTGPFDTYGLGSFWDRFLYWAPMIFGSLVLVRTVKPEIVARFPGKLLVQEFLTSLIFLMVFLPFLIVWTEYGFPDQLNNRPDWGTLSLYVVGICACIILAMQLIPHMFVRQDESVPDLDAPLRPRLTRRLPEGFTGKVLRLSGDGHFVKVSTSEGVFEIRLRLRDAIDEMHGVPGFCSHRSHWVATEAISDWKVRKGRPILILSNGDEVPVGAKYQPDLEAAGFVFDRGIATEKA